MLHPILAARRVDQSTCSPVRTVRTSPLEDRPNSEADAVTECLSESGQHRVRRVRLVLDEEQPLIVRPAALRPSLRTALQWRRDEREIDYMRRAGNVCRGHVADGQMSTSKLDTSTSTSGRADLGGPAGGGA